MSIPRFQPDKPIGKQFRAIESGCSWCQGGQDPPSGQTICGACVAVFHGILTSYRFRKARAQFFGRPGNQKCAKCNVNWSEELHHNKPWNRFPSLFWVQKYWEPICKTCHNQETAQQTKDRKANQQSPPPKPINSPSLIRDPKDLSLPPEKE